MPEASTVNSVRQRQHHALEHATQMRASLICNRWFSAFAFLVIAIVLGACLDDSPDAGVPTGQLVWRRDVISEFGTFLIGGQIFPRGSRLYGLRHGCRWHCLRVERF